jgi:hypothetical protein
VYIIYINILGNSEFIAQAQLFYKSSTVTYKHLVLPWHAESLESGGRAHTPGTLKDERRRVLGKRHFSATDSMKGTLREGSFTGNTKRYVKQGLEMGVCLHRGPAFGGHGGALLS